MTRNDRVNPRWRDSLVVKITAAMSALVTAAVLAGATLTFLTLRETVYDTNQKTLSAQASLLFNDLDGRINLLRDNLSALAANDLIADALVDDVGRNVYLRNFLSGIDFVEGFNASIGLVDFQGQTIATNGRNASVIVPAPWLASVVETGKASGFVVRIGDDIRLVLSEPVIYRNTGQPEGALFYQVTLGEWRNSERIRHILSGLPWAEELALVVKQVGDDPAAKRGDISFLSVEVPLDMSIVDGPNRVVMRLRASPEMFREPLSDHLATVSVTSLLVIIIAIILSNLLARQLTRKISRLHRETHELATDALTERRVTSDGRDEVDGLADTFNDLLGRLRGTYRQLEEQAAEEIASQAERYRTIIVNSAEGIITISHDGKIETFNPSAENLFGYKAEEVIGRNVSCLLPVSDRTDHDGYLKNANLHETKILNKARDLWALHKDGTVFPIELNVSPMVLGDERKYVGIMRDISERRRYEEGLKAARDEAEAASRTKSQFLSSMSHELRTPLNAIIGFSDLLSTDSEHPLADDQAESLGHIRKAGDLLLHLIDSVLELAKIESGKITLSIEAVDARTVLQDCLAMGRSMAKRNGVTVSGDFSELGGLSLKCDRVRLQQILLNLLSNAIKYNVDDGSVTLSAGKIGDDKCRISIADTGVGISADKQKMLFTPFARLGAENSVIEGTGIGLSIARQLARMMDAEIGFESTEGVGSKFWVDIPMAAGGEATVSGERESATPTVSLGTPSAEKTVQYVEDNPINLKLMRMILAKQRNIRFVSSMNAEDGVKQAAEERPDVILMDINLPGMNGIEALRAIREIDALSDTPVIAVSASAMASDVEAAMAAGFTAYVTKPFKTNELVSAIAQALDARSIDAD